MSNLKAQYSVIEEDGEFFIYDHEQDATVNRWGDVVDEGDPAPEGALRFSWIDHAESLYCLLYTSPSPRD